MEGAEGVPSCWLWLCSALAGAVRGSKVSCLSFFLTLTPLIHYYNVSIYREENDAIYLYLQGLYELVSLSMKKKNYHNVRKLSNVPMPGLVRK